VRCPAHLRSPFHFLLSAGIVPTIPSDFVELLVYQNAVTFAADSPLLTRELPRGTFPVGICQPCDGSNG